MSPDVKVALAGIAGYGDSYLQALLNDQRAQGTKLVGVVDSAPQRCQRLDDLRRRGVTPHPTMQSLFDSATVELMMIATPIHLHAPQTCFALARGASVLCEKPLATTLEDALRMVDCERTAKRFAAIGYQWSFSDAVQSLKADIISGELGRPLRMKSIAFFPRPASYFCRNEWAGRVRTSVGEAVFDSPANNATAHYLHNMLYLLGRARSLSATPLVVQAELYRANEIENYDTAALRATLAGGCELLFYTTHAVPQRLGPLCHFEFEHAVVEYDFLNHPQFVARFRDGSVRNYGDPNLDRNQKIWQCIDSVRTGKPIACGITAALPHALCVVAAQRSVPAIAGFPQSLRRSCLNDGERMLFIDGLDDGLTECYERGILPAEHGKLGWARPGTPVDCSVLSRSTRPAGVTVTLHTRPGVYAR
jgi:predicted dehydrogenase